MKRKKLSSGGHQLSRGEGENPGRDRNGRKNLSGIEQDSKVWNKGKAKSLFGQLEEEDKSVRRGGFTHS